MKGNLIYITNCEVFTRTCVSSLEFLFVINRRALLLLGEECTQQICVDALKQGPVFNNNTS